MLTPTWQMDLFIFETVILVPIYFFILVDIVISKRKYKSFKGAYYTLLVSQGVADIITIAIFSSLILARYFSIGNLFLYSLRPFAPLFYANSGPFMFTTRSIGVFMITTQRYLSVCRPSGNMYYYFNIIPSYSLVIVHWFVSVMIYLPAMLNSDAYFENDVSLFIMTSGRHAQIFSITVMISFATMGLGIIIMYSSIASAIVFSRSKSTSSSSKKAAKRSQDIRLAIHVFLLVTFSVISFFYYIGEYVLSFDDGRDRLKSFRLWYPTVSGNFSFINPISLLILNKDIQAHIVRFVCCVKPIAQSSVSIVMRKSTLKA